MKPIVVLACSLLTFAAVACGGPNAQMGHAALTPAGTTLPCSNGGNAGATSGPCPTFGNTPGGVNGNSDAAKLNMSAADAGAPAP